ncbi:MAG TPA: PEP-CTERM sorting domain-containing protein [Bryobacteraceae bacterium]
MAAQRATPRKVYRYSVVPGGVYSATELAAARRSDPVVRTHYEDFGDTVSVRKLSSDLLVYVSYRKANRVYWTTKKHRVCKGEAILTDGKNMARTRCGNRLSLTPQQPTLGRNEPSPKALDITDQPLLAGLPDGPLFFPNEGLPPLTLPEEARSGASPGPAIAPVPTGARADNFGPANFAPSLVPIASPAPLLAPFPGTTGNTPGGGGTTTGPGSPSTPVVPTDVPEPGSWTLFLFASVAALLWRRWRSPSTGPIDRRL